MTRVSDPSTFAPVDFDPTWTSEGGATSFTSQENNWFLYDPIHSNAADSAANDYQSKLTFGPTDTQSDTFAHLLEQSLGGPSKLDGASEAAESAPQQQDVLFAPVDSSSRLPSTSQRASRAADTAKRRPRRSSGSSNSVHVGSCSTGDRGFSPSWSRRSTSISNKSFSNSLSRFTLPDENGKRRIRNDIMSIAESLPALPGLYFDKKQKGFRVRYQNVYVGWVALSRFPSIEEAYISAREIWESAKSHAEKFQTPHAAVMASYPLQKEAQASGKNRGGRPRTVTQLPPDPSNWLSASAYITHQNPPSVPNWPPRTTEVPLYAHEATPAALCGEAVNDWHPGDVPPEGVDTFWSQAAAFSSNLTPGSGSKAETPHNYTFCQPPGLSGYLNDTCGLLERDDPQRFSSYSRPLCMPHGGGLEAFSELDQQSDFCRQFSTELPGAISYSQPVPEEAPEPPRKRRRDDTEEAKRGDQGTPVTQPREVSPPSDASTAIPPQSPNS